MSKTSSPTTPDLETDSYDEMLESVDTAIEQVEYKIDDGRIRDVDKAKVRIQYMRALGYLIRTKRKVLEDKNLEAMAQKIEEIEERKQREGRL